MRGGEEGDLIHCFLIVKVTYGVLTMLGIGGVISQFINATYRAIGSYCYYMEQIHENIWFTCQGSSHVGIIGTWKSPDINNDGKIDISDVAYVAFRFGTVEGNPMYVVDADLNNDGEIDILDVSYVAKYFGAILE